MKLIITRHGRTEWNAQTRTQGRTDIPLDETGLRQAQCFGKRVAALPVCAIYASPLSRAMQTAAPAGALLQLPVTPDERLIERDFGEWEGHAFSELAVLYPALWEQWKHDPSRCVPPHAETIEQVRPRCVDFLEDVQQKHPGQNDTVLVVCHSIPARVMVAELIGLPLARFHSIRLDNAAYSELDCHPGECKMVVLNDVCHLPEELRCK